MNVKYQVFISSTFRDLVEERQDAIRTVLDLGHIPSGMELFPASDQRQLEYIKKVIDECDYYVLIVGGRYGTAEDGVSYTEQEYEYALSTKKTVLAFLHADPSQITLAKSEGDPVIRARLETFRTRVATGRLVQMFDSREQLQYRIGISLMKAFSEFPGVGWVRGNQIASEDLLMQLNNVRRENDELHASVRELRQKLLPAVENIASLDEIHTFRYSYTVHYGRGISSETVTKTISIKWREVFVAVAPSLISPKSPYALTSGLKQYLNEQRSLPGAFSLNETDMQTVKVHLEAHGLISAYAAEAKGGGVSEFISLTDKGRKTMIDLMAVRSPSATPGGS